jgi:DNA uptake protein ComE-like DNA-binding protein
MSNSYSSGADAPFDGLIRLLVRTLSLGAVIGICIAGFYAVSSATTTSAPASAASSIKTDNGSRAGQGVATQAQATARVVYSGQSVPSDLVSKPEPAVMRAPATPFTAPSDAQQGQAQGGPLSAAPSTQQAPAPVSVSNSSPPPPGGLHAASLSEKVEAPAPQTGTGVNINTATLEELNRLSGGGLIGRAIIRGRPYTSPDDLLKKQVLSRAVYNRIKDQVAAR